MSWAASHVTYSPQDLNTDGPGMEIMSLTMISAALWLTALVLAVRGFLPMRGRTGAPVPGWYPDPTGEAHLRYWDGEWTGWTV